MSSFGLTGTNVHAVLEQAPVPDLPTVDGQESGVELVTVSAKSSAALARYCRRLAAFVDDTGHSLRSVSHVMNRGRDDHPYRLAFAVADKRELADALRTAVVPEHAVVPDSRVVLLFSADARIDEPDWSRLCGELPELATVVDEMGEIDTSLQSLLVARQWALRQLILSWGLTDPHFVGNGTGNLVVRCAQGELSTQDAVLAAAGATPSTEIDRSRLRQVVQEFRRSGAVLVEMGADGVLSREIRRVAPELPTVALLDSAGHRGLLEQLGRIYTLGGTPNWERYYQRAGITRIEAPTYPFEPVRCWVQPAGVGTAAGETANRDALPPRRTDPPPDADTERHIAAVWEDVLKATDLHPESDYFALGGTSIAGISVLRRLEQDLGVTLGFADLYAHRTVRSLADRVDQLRSTEHEADHDRLITPIRRGGRLPLSFGQEQLWYLDYLNPDSPLYNIPADQRLRGPLDVAALRGALQDLATRHQVLRTCIRSDDGEPYVQVLPALPELPLLDLSTLPPTERDREAHRLAEAEAVQPFDLAEGPLWRTTLLKLGEDDHVLLYTYHHIIFDGWSPSVFFRDFFELYRARRTGQPAELPKLPIQYADFAAWQRSWLSGQRLETSLNFWRDQLAGLHNGELPLDRPRPPTQSFAGDLVEFTIDIELATRVREFSQRQSVTTFVTMLAVVDALLHRWAHLDDVVVGVGTSGRVNPATHELVGYFNNLPPFRTRVSGDLLFTELVRRCANTVAGVLDHEEMPLEKIVSAVCRRRDPARHPLFDVAYTYQNAPAPTGDLAELTSTRYLDSGIAGIAPGTAKFDLTFGVTDQGGGQMYAYIEYAVALFDRDTARRLADWLLAILDAAMTDPRQRIDQLPESPRQPTGQPSVLTGVRPDPVERVLVAHPSVHEALVVAATPPSGSTRLIANVTTTLPPPAENDLIAWAAHALPSSMVPSQVVVHERLPRTATGKLDRKGTKELTMSTTKLGTATNDLHADEAVQVLARICADVLSIDRVSPDDNFFDLGGDSVLGVRVAARAAKAGVFFTPQQLAGHQTLRELAAAAVATDISQADEGTASSAATMTARTVVQPGGPIHLTPIMHNFLDRMSQGARNFLEVHPLETTTSVDGETVRAAVDHVLARHEPLRYRFRHNSLGWRIDCAEPGTMDVFDVQVLPPMGEQDELAILAADLEELRSRIDLERGPALRVRYYHRGHNRNGWIVFVAHHFVFDNMAAVVLIDDLDAALTDITAGRSLDLPRPSLAWREWSQHLQDMAVSDELAGELTYWTGILRAGAATITHTEGPARAGAAGIVSRNLDPGRVAEVLKGGPHSHEAAMCAFACALARWRGTTSAYVMTEGAATPNMYRPTGRPPAVGWFTTLHPLVLPVDPGTSVLDCLPAVADRVRSVPNDGVGYGILRHLTPDSPALARLRSLPEPEALVLHSSHGESGLDSGVRLLRSRFDLLAGAPKPLIECLPLGLSTTVTTGALQVAVIHDGRYGEEEIESLADEVARAFTELVT